MPSSRDEVATTAGSRPALSASSISDRCSRDTEPWWARAISTVPSRPKALPHGADGRPTPPWPGCSAGKRAALEVDARTDGGDLVDAGGQPLGGTTGVAEHDRRAVRGDQVDDPLLDGRPHRLPLLAVEGGHVLDRYDDGDLDRLAGRRLDDDDLSGAAEEPGDLVDRADGGGQPDPLGRLLEQRVEPLQGQREVGAALGAGHGVHLVDDHRLDAAQRLAGGAEVRMRNSDSGVVMKMSGGVFAKARRSSAGVSPDRSATVMSGSGRSSRWAACRMPVSGRAQVALDVDGERLQRRDVEDPGAPQGLGRARRGGELVERPQEGGQRLAGTGRARRRGCSRHR